jgi:hypothetical protein
MSDTTLKFGSSLAISSSEKERIYHQIFSQKTFISLLSDTLLKKNTAPKPTWTYNVKKIIGCVPTTFSYHISTKSSYGSLHGFFHMTEVNYLE